MRRLGKATPCLALVHNSAAGAFSLFSEADCHEPPPAAYYDYAVTQASVCAGASSSEERGHEEHRFSLHLVDCGLRK